MLGMDICTAKDRPSADSQESSIATWQWHALPSAYAFVCLQSPVRHTCSRSICQLHTSHIPGCGLDGASVSLVRPLARSPACDQGSGMHGAWWCGMVKVWSDINSTMLS